MASAIALVMLGTSYGRSIAKSKEGTKHFDSTSSKTHQSSCHSDIWLFLFTMIAVQQAAYTHNGHDQISIILRIADSIKCSSLECHDPVRSRQSPTRPLSTAEDTSTPVALAKRQQSLNAIQIPFLAWTDFTAHEPFDLVG